MSYNLLIFSFTSVIYKQCYRIDFNSQTHKPILDIYKCPILKSKNRIGKISKKNHSDHNAVNAIILFIRLLP